ncbi:MAG: hypothetical protein R3C56_30585 [Pirellulaceae bacterium]
MARRLASELAIQPEVRDYQVYVGISSPMDFNGMVRHYFLRKGTNVADIRVVLCPKRKRVQQSHEILLRVRKQLTELAETLGANIKLVEVPPGPPVLSTLTPRSMALQACIATTWLWRQRSRKASAREPGG